MESSDLRESVLAEVLDFLAEVPEYFAEVEALRLLFPDDAVLLLPADERWEAAVIDACEDFFLAEVPDAFDEVFFAVPDFLVACVVFFVVEDFPDDAKSIPPG